MNTPVKLFLSIGLIALSFKVNSQLINTIKLSFLYDSKPLNVNDSALLFNDSNNLKINTLKFYISNIRLLKNTKVVLHEKNSFHLVDASKEITQLIKISNTKTISFDELKFDLGIDSVTNVSGVLGGDLDPTNGMYWAWQSGYINFKLEGTSQLSKARNNEFQFHLGGYVQPNGCLQTLNFKVNNLNTINITLDVNEILRHLDLGKINHIMSPSSEAVRLSKIVANAFKLK